MTDNSPYPDTKSWAVRLAVAAVAVGLAAVSVIHRAGWDRDHREALQLLDSTGLAARQPEVAASAAWDPDPVRSRLAVARGLLAEAYDPDAFAKLPAREAADAGSRVSERLEQARGIAASALAELPAAWQAAMIIGGATNRLWTLAGDPRLFTERSAWEAPLRAAARLAPGQIEPQRPLTVTWLETWAFLSPAQRADARATLQRAFSDRDTFRQCAGLWLAAAADRDEAFSLVPDLPWAWMIVEEALRRREDWAGYCEARVHRDLAAARLAESRVREAAARLRGGDLAGARSLALSVIAEVPVNRRFAPTLRAALAQCPPGSLTLPPVTIRRWLELAADGCARGQEWVPTEVVARLVVSASDLADPMAALAALASGDLTAAEVIERRTEAAGTEPWAPYWIAKARVLARSHHDGEGVAALKRINRNWRSSIPAIEARLAVAEAANDTDDAGAAKTELARAAAASWQGTDWTWRGPSARLDMFAMRDAPGLDITLDEFPIRGTVVQVSLDGVPVAVAPALDHEGVSVASPISRGPHLVEIIAIAGGRVVPGELTLR